MSTYTWYGISVLSLCLVRTAAAADFDNALVIVVDDLGTDKVGAYAVDVENPGESRPETPEVDLLAGAGVRFSDAWSSPVCSPARGVLYTGEYAYRNGVGNVIKEGSSTRLSTAKASIAKLAQDNGLKTALFGKWHVGELSNSPDAPTTTPLNLREYPVQVGFGTFAGNMDGELDSYTDWLYTTSSATGSRYTTTATTLTSSATDRTTSDAISWMETQSAAGKRTLTVVSYNLPHATLDAAGGWTWSDAASACGAVPSADEVANYHAAVSCMDAAIAELLAGTPALDRTLVILLGDNGTDDEVAEGSFADGRGKATVYENGVRVPFVVADGAAVQDALDAGVASGSYRFGPGRVVSDPSSTVDVYATIADFLSLSSSTCTPGVTCGRDSSSLRSVLGGGAPLRDETWTEMFSKSSSGGYSGSAALRFGDHKLLVTVAASATPCRSYSLYDLVADRWETHDLFGDPSVADEQAVLLALLADHASTMAGASVNWLPAADCS